MRHLWIILAGLSWWALILSGCASPPAVSPVTTDWLILSGNIAEAGPAWHAETMSAGLTDPFVLVVHGNEQAGRWVCLPDATPGMTVMDVEQAAWLLRKLMPERDIVLLTCNPGGHELDVPRVWHATEDVWSTPGPRERDYRGGRADFVGSLSEFQVAR